MFASWVIFVTTYSLQEVLNFYSTNSFVLRFPSKKGGALLLIPLSFEGKT